MGNQTITDIFELNDFRDVVRFYAEQKPRGEYRRIAEALRMHTTLLSQIMSGKKCLTVEQAAILCEHINLSNAESDYFLLLVQKERAGNHKLKSIFERHIQSLKSQIKQVRNHVPESVAMTESDRALYYSSWQYALIRLATDIEKFQTADAISRQFSIPLERVNEILDFLKAKKLCQEVKKGHFKRTAKNTHIEAGSSLSVRHHQNWRTQSARLLEKMRDDDLAFTAPISLSTDDRAKIRHLLLDTISKIGKTVQDSEPEEIVYLGIDWLKV